MKPHDLKLMSLDELWSLHQLVASALARKIPTEMARLDQRLHEVGLSKADRAKKTSTARRPYPRVLPKFKNPTRPSETWAGRGKLPRWLVAQLSSGKKLDDFRI
jgi:DNA-binding protein H-NS